MFTDSVILKLFAGKGGNGVVAWRREKYIPKGGPAGGNGGLGGSICIEADENLISLENIRHQKVFKARNGDGGGGNNRQGKNGNDLIIKVPLGTLVKDAKTNEVLYDFSKHSESWKICKGGKGGKGNTHFKSPTNQAPLQHTLGTEGESKEVHLELKLIADIGLVGMPNAGKSTFMSKVCHVNVKIAPYPFTTLLPNIGMIEFKDDFSRMMIADIPGIISDAHKNKGLGLSFLKHIERTHLLVYVIDISAIEGRDPTEDFETLQTELRSYNPELLQKPFLIALNKMDEPEAHENYLAFIDKFPQYKGKIFPISALTEDQVPELLFAIKNLK